MNILFLILAVLIISFIVVYFTRNKLKNRDTSAVTFYLISSLVLTIPSVIVLSIIYNYNTGSAYFTCSIISFLVIFLIHSAIMILFGLYYDKKKKMRQERDLSRYEAERNVSDESIGIAYSIVICSFGLKANAEGIRDMYIKKGFDAKIVFNESKSLYRVIIATSFDKAYIESLINSFREKYPDDTILQKAWILESE